jgi:hypothetical protein
VAADAGFGPTETRMRAAPFCLSSLLLTMLAVGVHCGALRDWSRNAGIRARSLSATQDPRAVMHAEADRLSHRGSSLYVVGLGFAVGSAAALTVSFRRHELARWRGVPVALLMSYVMLQFILV